MKKVLYLTNIEVPYRADFFTKLAQECDLTVLYERRKSTNRDAEWSKSGTNDYKKIYLDGYAVGNENSFSLRIIKEIRKGYDIVIVGCYNSPVQMLAIQMMRLLRIPFLINMDGEQFIGNEMKAKLKKFFLNCSRGYLMAGNKSAESLQKVVNTNKPCSVYYLSSLSHDEILKNARKNIDRDGSVVVIGQNFPYKGMDIALQMARRMPDVKFKFVGMGKRTDLFLSEMGPIPENVEVIPFLQKPELEKLYLSSSVLLLPSRQECWGLVVNEAASYGTPIVSTYGSGAAVEFLADEYPQYLAAPGDVESLEKALKKCLSEDNTQYSEFLKQKALDYTIERSVECHINAFNSFKVGS